MAALQQSLTLEKSASFFARFTLTKLGAPINLAGIAASFRIKKTVNETTIYTTWPAAGATVTTTAGGVITVKATKATVDALPVAPVEYVLTLVDYDVDTGLASVGNTFRVAYGAIIVSEDP